MREPDIFCNFIPTNKTIDKRGTIINKVGMDCLIYSLPKNGHFPLSLFEKWNNYAC
jgi:hypothetical protein